MKTERIFYKLFLALLFVPFANFAFAQQTVRPIIQIPPTRPTVIIPPSALGDVLPTPQAVSPPSFVPQVRASVVFSDNETRRIEDLIRNATQFCRRIEAKEYWVDCLSNQFEDIAESIPEGGDYEEARQAIGTAAQKLKSLAQSHASTELPRGHVESSGTDGARSTRPLTPVRSEDLQEISLLALNILDELETTLLRSAENSAVRKVHFESIANAVGSNKVLLRSI